MANGGFQRVDCVCGLTHQLTPTAMAIVIEAYQSGDMQTLGNNGEIRFHCILHALATMDVVAVSRRYRGSIRWKANTETDATTMRAATVQTVPQHSHVTTQQNGATVSLAHNIERSARKHRV